MDDTDEILARGKAINELIDALKYMIENAEAQGWSEFMLEDAKKAIERAEKIL